MAENLDERVIRGRLIPTVEAGRLLRVQEFLNEHGDNMSAKTSVLCEAIEKDDVDLVRFMIGNGFISVHGNGQFHWAPLHHAAMMGRMEVVRFLIENDASVHARDRFEATPLHNAANHGRLDVARLLIEHGADVHARDLDGRTPLFVAYSGNYFDVARLLIDHGASINARDNRGMTALIWMCDWVRPYDPRRQNTLEHVLGEEGFEINAQYNHGQTALYCACRRGILWVVQMLLSRGANFRLQTAQGETPLDVACRSNHSDIVWTLLRHDPSLLWKYIENSD